MAEGDESDDVLVALDIVAGHLPPGAGIQGAFLTQIYAIGRNKTAVDAGVRWLRETKRVKALDCRPQGLPDWFLVRTECYCALIPDGNAGTALTEVITTTSLMSGPELVPEPAAEELARSGWLLLNRPGEEVQRLSHPALSRLCAAVEVGAAGLDRYLLARSREEMEERALLRVMAGESPRRRGELERCSNSKRAQAAAVRLKEAERVLSGEGLLLYQRGAGAIERVPAGVGRFIIRRVPLEDI
jgi:hypothetical protein